MLIFSKRTENRKSDKTKTRKLDAWQSVPVWFDGAKTRMQKFRDWQNKP